MTTADLPSDAPRPRAGSRHGCCGTWPKPCPYHEGWADAKDALAEDLAEAVTLLRSGRLVELGEERRARLVALLGALGA